MTPIANIQRQAAGRTAGHRLPCPSKSYSSRRYRCPPVNFRVSSQTVQTEVAPPRIENRPTGKSANGAVASAPAQRRQSSPRVDPKNVLVFILGGGQGNDLYPLTRSRAEPAVPLLGTYRLVDVPVSNCLNSGLNKIFVLAQYQSRGLTRHLSEAYNFVSGNNFNSDSGFVETLNATQRPGYSSWFKGTADAVRQFLWQLEDERFESVEEVLILCSDHMYRMNYMDMINRHRASGADVTLATLPCTVEEAPHFGVLQLNNEMRVTAFQEKPCSEDLDCLVTDTTLLGLQPSEAVKRPFAASMGMYVFKRSLLQDLLQRRFPEASDFSREVLKPAVKDLTIQGYSFTGFWRDIGTLSSFFDAHMAMANDSTEARAMQLWNTSRPLFTNSRVNPISKVRNSEVTDSMLGHGCMVDGATLRNCILGDATKVGSGSHLEEVITFGSDMEIHAEEGDAPVGIGRNCTLRRVILDKDVSIGDGCVITNEAGVKEARREKEGYCIRDGIVVFLKGAVIPPGTKI